MVWGTTDRWSTTFTWQYLRKPVGVDIGSPERPHCYLVLPHSPTRTPKGQPWGPWPPPHRGSAMQYPVGWYLQHASNPVQRPVNLLQRQSRVSSRQHRAATCVDATRLPDSTQEDKNTVKGRTRLPLRGVEPRATECSIMRIRYVNRYTREVLSKATSSNPTDRLGWNGVGGVKAVA
ncbi:hypothetical protein BT67DRAFT_123986 [Trichocladium antarcticum]|uniref:Uncharacterized protein n=1 Tax=Trichocladium antarcticum TaxID=1450529 RepID=A0AAN6UU29_9PEZI|nr:hypothetical protein BT67DRAFT_123986 [Trichocladium antarcticum]